MIWKTAWAAFGVGMGLVFGDAPKPDKSPHAKPKVIDLDFSEDNGDWMGPPMERDGHAAPHGGHAASHRWLYWTLGAGAAAAGGVGWYLFRDAKEPAAARNEQVFTDER
jgi:hypothetical protein